MIEGEIKRISTGSTLLDCELGGGFPLGRLITVSGWQSTGKTGIAIESCANFASSYPNGRIGYIDSEAAFDVPYAEQLGLPVDQVEFLEAATVEEFDSLLRTFIADAEEGEPGLMILDSLDALSTNKEKSTELVDRSGYGAEKAKLIGDILKNSVSDLAKTDIALLLIQQLRDNITGYGPKGIKSGGKSIGFFATIEIELKKAKLLERTIDGVTRAYGVEMSFYVKKNKVGPQFGEAEFVFLFGYGTDDTTSCLKYLKTVNRITDLPKEFIMTGKDKVLERETAIAERIETGDPEVVRKNRKLVSEITKKVWHEIKEKHDVKKLSKY